MGVAVAPHEERRFERGGAPPIWRSCAANANGRMAPFDFARRGDASVHIIQYQYDIKGFGLDCLSARAIEDYAYAPRRAIAEIAPPDQSDMRRIKPASLTVFATSEIERTR